MGEWNSVIADRGTGSVIEFLELAVVASAGVYFVALGGSAFLSPPATRRFLLGFASTPAKHYVELAARALLGGAFVVAAPMLPLSGPFNLFGWMLVGTTLVLVLVPWRWHHRFAQRVVPEALRFLPVLGACSLLLGALVLWAVWHGYAA